MWWITAITHCAMLLVISASHERAWKQKIVKNSQTFVAFDGNDWWESLRLFSLALNELIGKFRQFNVQTAWKHSYNCHKTHTRAHLLWLKWNGAKGFFPDYDITTYAWTWTDNMFLKENTWKNSMKENTLNIVELIFWMYTAKFVVLSSHNPADS